LAKKINIKNKKRVSSKKPKINKLFTLKNRLFFSLVVTFVLFAMFYSEDIALSYRAGGINGIYERFKNFDVNQISEYDEFDPVELDNNYVLFNVFEVRGVASYYADKFVGRKTANGERFSQNDFSAAHKKLAFGTIVKVTNLDNYKCTLVRINDRGPFARNRVIDLSKRASNLIDAHGTSPVKIEGVKRMNKYISQKPAQYYNGYSTISDFVTLPQNELKLMDSTLSFNEIMDIYLDLIEQKPINHLYIFQKALKFEKETKETKDGEDYYYLGYVENIQKQKK